MDNTQIDLTILVRCEKCSTEKPIKSFRRNKDGTLRGKNICHGCRRGHEREKQRLWMQQYRIDYREYTNKLAKESHSKSRRANPERFLLYSVQQRAKQKSIPCTLTLEDIVIPKYCPVLGIELRVNYDGGQATDNSPSVDRIKPELGYVKGNVAIISKRANTIKSFGTVEEHQKIIDYMEKHK